MTQTIARVMTPCLFIYKQTRNLTALEQIPGLSNDLVFPRDQTFIYAFKKTKLGFATEVAAYRGYKGQVLG